MINKIVVIFAIICISSSNVFAQISLGRVVSDGSQLISGGYSVPAIQRSGGIYASGISGLAPSAAATQLFALVPVGNVGYGSVAAPAIGLSSGISGVAVGGLAGLRSGVALGSAAISSQNVGPINAAIITRRNVEVVDVPVPQDVITPQTLVVEPNQLPVNIEFRSQSSPVNVNQVHIPGPPGTVQQTSSEEEADRLIHEVVKPVIQEIRETITPYRTITQEILPVQENVNTIVARGEGVRQQVVAAPAVAAVQPVSVAAVQPISVAAVQPVSVATFQPISVGAVAQPVPVSVGLIGSVANAGLAGSARRVAFGGISGISGGSARVVSGAGLAGGRVFGQPILNRRA